jgi:hypothetical protein
VVGILITPLDEGEKKQFSDYAKAVSTLISGYLLAKLEKFPSYAKPWMATAGTSLFLPFLLFSTCFLIGTLFTFIGRRYVRGTEDERRQKRQKTLDEINKSLTKLSSLN